MLLHSVWRGPAAHPAFHEMRPIRFRRPINKRQPDDCGVLSPCLCVIVQRIGNPPPPDDDDFVRVPTYEVRSLAASCMPRTASHLLCGGGGSRQGVASEPPLSRDRKDKSLLDGTECDA
jgi:hypothetical protein